MTGLLPDLERFWLACAAGVAIGMFFGVGLRAWAVAVAHWRIFLSAQDAEITDE